MNTWTSTSIHLEGEIVELLPLDKKHLNELEILAKDPRIWEYYACDCSRSDTFKSVYKEALIEKENGTVFPFVIYHKADNKIIGSTQYMNIQEKHRKLEIGWTWIHPTYWRTEVNLECKLLLLTHCFEEFQANRVQIKTDQKNERSKKAIEKIGGEFEGLLRNDMIRENGTMRHSLYFSIINEEWPEKKAKLKNLLLQKIEQNK